MHLVDSLGNNQDLTPVCNLHEQACAIAADAYGQYTNNLGVSLVTTGPGGTNAITGVAAAWLDSTPTLFISGQVKRPDLKTGKGVRQFGFQEIDIAEMVSSITKYAVCVTDPSEIRYHMEKAIYLARSGRPGPVWIDIPLDVQAQQIEPAQLRGFDPQELVNDEVTLAKSEIQSRVTKSLEILKQAKRPAVLVGNGVRLAKALEPLKTLLEQWNIPVLTTWKMIDFLPDNHPLSVGRPGAVAQRAANLIQQTADCLLILGARLDMGQTGYNHENFAKTAQKIIVDVDTHEIDKLQMKFAVKIPANLSDVVAEFQKQSTDMEPLNCAPWWKHCRELKARFPMIQPEFLDVKDGVNLYVFMEALSATMKSGDLLVPGSSGGCSETTMQAYRCPEGVRVFNSEGLGPMGFGIAAPIGACIASGGRRTISLDGDGGFQMNIQELETLKRLNLDIKIFVLNNDGYVSIRSTQKNYFNSRFYGSSPAGGLTLPDTIALSQAYGLKTAQISDQTDMEQQIEAVLNTPGPVICEIKITPSQTTYYRVSSYQKEDGSMASRPMEDLWPLLERDEFEQIMNFK